MAHYAIAEKVIELPQAIRSCSGLPADIIGLTDRGGAEARHRLAAARVALPTRLAGSKAAALPQHSKYPAKLRLGLNRSYPRVL